MTEKLPETMEELAIYIIRHASRIPVREEVNGKIDSYYLTELPAELAIKHALSFLVQGKVPVYIKDTES